MSGHIADSGNIAWCTPPKIISVVNAYFRECNGVGIQTDPCWNPSSEVKAERRFVYPKQDGLKDPWMGNTYVNPPYGVTHYPKTGEDRAPLAAKDYRKLIKAGAKEEDYTSSSVSDWLRLCGEYSKNTGNPCVAYVPASVGSGYWFDLVWGKASVVLERSRPKFHMDGVASVASAPMYCALVVFQGEELKQPLYVFNDIGKIIPL